MVMLYAVTPSYVTACVLKGAGGEGRRGKVQTVTCIKDDAKRSTGRVLIEITVFYLRCIIKRLRVISRKYTTRHYLPETVLENAQE